MIGKKGHQCDQKETDIINNARLVKKLYLVVRWGIVYVDY